MDYEATDRYMSSWVVTCTKNETRFFLTDDGLASDILSRAAIYRWADKAEQAAIEANAEKAWDGFLWEEISVPEAVNLS